MYSKQPMPLKTRSDGQFSLDIDPLRSEFTNDTTEFRFLTDTLADTQSQLRIALFFCSFFYLAFILTDIAVLGYGRDTFILFLGRSTVAVTAVICSWLTYRQPTSVAMTRLAATVVEVVGMSTFMLVVIYRPSELPWHAMSMAIMLFVVYIFIPNRLVYSLAVSIGATGAFVILAFTGGHLKPADILTMSMLLLLANTFGFVAARRYQRVRREASRTQTDLENLSVHDHLTGCFNRRYLHDKLLDNEVLRAQRYHQCLTVIMCDLDHFKAVNDSFGHHGGDAVLRDFSQLLRKMTRKQIDSVVRYGGEEFLLILPETDLKDGVLLADRLRRAFAGADTAHGANKNISATASFGVATFDFARSKEVITLDGLIASADNMLYHAKSGGRNQVRSILMT